MKKRGGACAGTAPPSWPVQVRANPGMAILGVLGLLLLSSLSMSPFFEARSSVRGLQRELWPFTAPVPPQPSKKELKILAIVGTRPEAVKMAPIIWRLRRECSEEESWCSLTALNTEQHAELVPRFFDLFDIKADAKLTLEKTERTLATLTADITRKMEVLLLDEEPDIVLVQGDTTSAMAAAMAAFYLNIPVGHVEAGLRTYEMRQPFPEEYNRQVIGRIASVHFAPTALAACRLLQEGIPYESIVHSGNTVVDTFRWGISEIKAKPSLGALAAAPFKEAGLLYPQLVGMDSSDSRFSKREIVLVTVHRRENHGSVLLGLCGAFSALAARYPAVDFVYPVHPNPAVKDVVTKQLAGVPNIWLLPPLEYLQLIQLMAASKIVLTDSGGLQEEATVMSKPVLVLRKETERIEGVVDGAAALVGVDPTVIEQHVTALLHNEDGVFDAMSAPTYPYGDGHATERIVSSLQSRHGDLVSRSNHMGSIAESKRGHEGQHIRCNSLLDTVEAVSHP